MNVALKVSEKNLQFPLHIKQTKFKTKKTVSLISDFILSHKIKELHFLFLFIYTFVKYLIGICGLLGNRSTAVEINLPTSGCGIRSEPQPDGSLEMSVRLVIQMDEKLRQRSDLEKMVRCILPNQMMEMNIGMTDEKRAVRYDF